MMANPWEKYSNPAGRYGPDPTKVAAEKRAAEDQEFQRQQAAIAAATAARAENNSAQSNLIAAQNADLQQKRFQAELAQKGLMLDENGQIVTKPTAAILTKPEMTGAQYADALAQYNASLYLRDSIAKLRGLNAKGPGATKGIEGALDFLPTQTNSGFNKEADRLRAWAKQGTGTTGGENNSVAEMKLNLGAYIPNSWDFDSTNEGTLASLEQLADKSYRESIQRLGGVPDAAGRIAAIDPNVGPPPLFKEQQQRKDAPPIVLGGGPSVTDKSSRLTGGSQGPQKTLGTSRQYSTENDLSVAQRLEALFDSGASIAQINAEAARLNSSIPPAKVVEAVAWRDGLGKYADRKVYPYNKSASIVRPDMTGRRSDTEIMANRALLHPLGTAATTGVNALSLGTLEAIAPEALAQQRETNPIAGFAGDVGGMLGGTSALAAAGSRVAGRLAPSLLTGGGRAGNVARAVAPDAAYGALYNANIGENPLTGAALGAAGSGAGQLLGKGAQKALGGFRGSPQAQMLEQSGIPLTVGQRAGGMLKSTEDAMSSAPILGDLVNMRRAEGLESFNLNALNEAGRPIGATVAETGGEGFNALRSQVGDAYSRATQGVDVPLDNTFASDMQAVSQRAGNLPDDYLAAFNQVGQNRVGPIVQRGKLTGEDYQQTMRGLKTARSNAGKIGTTGFEGEYRDSVTAAMDALKGQMQRGGGQPVVEGLQNADAANRLAKTIEAAQFAAKNDAGGAGIRMFTPAQLNTAAYATQKKFPGIRPFAEMADTAQMVLPNKIPDSGTARRGASLLLPASLGGTGAGIDQYASGTPWEGAATGLSAGALMLLGGTKGGQKAINAALFKRNKAFKRAGGLLGRRKTRQGLGSVVTAPILIGNE